MLYHVTFARNLNGIATDGLGLGQGRNFLNLQFHARKKLFLTTYETLGCWFHKIHYVGFDASDHVVEDGLFPVALRIADPFLEEIINDIREDSEGDRDCPGESFYILRPISAEYLDLWNGTSWVPLYAGATDDMIEAAKARGELHVDDYEQYHAEWYVIADDAFQPRTASARVRLWRAAKDNYLSPPNAFAREREVAEAYLDNPGYGGEFLYTTTVAPQKVLDLYSEPRAAMDTLLEITHLRNPGAISVDEFVLHQYVADALAEAGYDWAVVHESYPEGTETWVWLGGEEPELVEVGE